MSDHEAQENLFNKIRGLLLKAESTPYEEEAASFMRKAQELITKYAVDEEVLWASDPSRRTKIERVRIKLEDRQSGSYHKKELVHVIASNNNCRTWFWKNENEQEIVGYPNDVMFAEMLYRSILVQMNFLMAHAMAHADVQGNSRTFRRDFIAGFVERVVTRLNEAKRNADEYVREDQGSGPSTALVLVGRKQKVDEWVFDNIPGLRPSNQQDRSQYGGARAAGRIAGDRADISGGKGGALSKGKRALPRG